MVSENSPNRFVPANELEQPTVFEFGLELLTVHILNPFEPSAEQYRVIVTHFLEVDVATQVL